MPRSLEVFFHDILEAASKIDRYIEGMSLEAFRQDERTVDAVIRNLEVIGEATKKIPESIRQRIPRSNGSRSPASEIF